MIIGKTIESTKDISFGLSSTLADTYTLYLKTQNYYWNATGPRFHQLHIIFKEQYKEMAASLDYIAERIRGLGHRSPGSFKEFLKLNSIPEQIGALDEDSMITELVKGHEAI